MGLHGDDNGNKEKGVGVERRGGKRWGELEDREGRGEDFEKVIADHSTVWPPRTGIA